MTKEEIKTGIRESEEEIRKLRRDKKGNWKQFVKYYEGYIHGLKAAQPKQGEGVKRRPCTCHLKPYSEFTPLEKEYGCYNCSRKPTPPKG